MAHTYEGTLIIPRTASGGTGTQGAKGDQGIQGIQGIQGVKGDKGADGLNGTGTGGASLAPGTTIASNFTTGLVNFNNTSGNLNPVDYLRFTPNIKKALPLK